MRVLFLGNSNILNKKIIPSLINDKNFKCEIASRKKVNNDFFTKTYNNYQKALSKTKAKLVYISLINSLHYSLCKKALLSNKHVIVDKPLTLNSKNNFELINIAKKRRLLLIEATVFFYNKRFKKFYSLINFNKKIDLEINFSIPSLDKNNFRNYINKGGGCFNDMSPYAIKCIHLFNKRRLLKIDFLKKTKNKSICEFAINIKEKFFKFSGIFKFNSKYKNFMKIKNGKNIIYLPMAFSQLLDTKSYFIINKSKKYFKFENSFHTFLISIKNAIKQKKNFNKYYNELTNLTKIRELIEKKI